MVGRVIDSTEEVRVIVPASDDGGRRRLQDFQAVEASRTVRTATGTTLCSTSVTGLRVRERVAELTSWYIIFYAKFEALRRGPVGGLKILGHHLHQNPNKITGG